LDGLGWRPQALVGLLSGLAPQSAGRRFGAGSHPGAAEGVRVRLRRIGLAWGAGKSVVETGANHAVQPLRDTDRNPRPAGKYGALAGPSRLEENRPARQKHAAMEPAEPLGSAGRGGRRGVGSKGQGQCCRSAVSAGGLARGRRMFGAGIEAWHVLPFDAAIGLGRLGRSPAAWKTWVITQ